MWRSNYPRQKKKKKKEGKKNKTLKGPKPLSQEREERESGGRGRALWPLARDPHTHSRRERKQREREACRWDDDDDRPTHPGRPTRRQPERKPAERERERERERPGAPVWPGAGFARSTARMGGGPVAWVRRRGKGRAEWVIGQLGFLDRGRGSIENSHGGFGLREFEFYHQINPYTGP